MRTVTRTALTDKRTDYNGPRTDYGGPRTDMRRGIVRNVRIKVVPPRAYSGTVSTALRIPVRTGARSPSSVLTGTVSQW